ncbi:MAG: alcohol dehydrogenase [Deltaproteobacteria bacterium RIFCSPHIGHO2_02_FULL_40_11]|nr:MAG: alcohol dehydrogenase [Deltaproteobacteria bacterium RIFCSPHIGHO2_02_FULL_40_11]
MKAIVFHQPGGVDVLKYEDVDVPRLGSKEVLIQVKACALNHLDIWVRGGLGSLPMPHVLGSDVSGVIEDTGSEVLDLKKGEPILVSPGMSCGVCERCLQGKDNLCPKYTILGKGIWGGYAQFVKVPRQNILPYPKNLKFEEAACMPLTFLTAWQMLVEKAKVKLGDTVLVLAAGSGIGVAAIQIARLFGATVIATASMDEKLQKAKELGAEHCINYAKEDFLKEVKKITEGRGVDIVVEHTGAQTWEKSILSAKWGGTIVTCGATSGDFGKTDLRHVYFRQLQILGSTMGSKGALFEIIRHIESGHLKPVLDEVLPLKEAARAHQKMESRQQFGKIVLVP